LNLGILVKGGPHDMDEGAPETPAFDFEQLYTISKTVTKNLNRVIDVNYYPVKEAKNSNMRHRPVGIGVQVRSGENEERMTSVSTPCRFAHRRFARVT